MTGSARDPRPGTNASRLLAALRRGREIDPAGWYINPRDWGLDMNNRELLAAQRHLRKLGHDVCAHIEFSLKEDTTCPS